MSLSKTNEYRINQTLHGSQWFLVDDSVSLKASGPGGTGDPWVRIVNDLSQSGHRLVADAVKFTWSTNQSALMPFLKSVVRTDTAHCLLTWCAQPGYLYRVQAKASLSDANWTDLTSNFPAGDTTATWTDTVLGTPQRFYRVVRAQ